MTKAVLRISLDESSARYLPGQPLHGRVELEVPAPVSCRISIVARWGVSTRAPSGGTGELEIYRGECTAGETLSQPFTIDLPRGPLTYDGELVNLVWWIEAHAQLSAGSDQTTKAVISLHSDGSVDPDWGLLYDKLSHQFHLAGEILEKEKPQEAPERIVIKPTPGMKAGCIACGLAPVAVGVILILWILFGSLSRGDTQSVVILIAALVLGGVVLSRLVWVVFLGNWLATRRLGDVRFDVTPRLVRSGAPISFRVSFNPRKALAIDGAVATLEAEERLEQKGERRTTIRRHTVSRTEQEFSPRRDLPAGLPVVLGGTIRLPENPPASFGAEHQELSWRLGVRVRIRGGADWESTRLILVYP